MLDAGKSSLYRLRGFFSGINCRPTRLAEDVSHYFSCRLCQVLPRRTVMLPCQHTLCEPCVGGILQQSAGICPFDGEAFEKDECRWNEIPAKKTEGLKAHCWNEVHGCDFVGTLQAMLRHYEEECSFHQVSCPRCGGSVLNGDLPSHHAVGCTHVEPSIEADQHSLNENPATPSDTTRVLASGTKTPLRDRYEEEIPVLETRMNELTEQTREHEANLRQIPTMLEGTLQALNIELTQALANFSAIFTEAIQTQQRTNTSSEPDTSSSGESAALTEVEANEVPAQLHLEKMHILRNLERMLSGVVGYLEDMSYCNLLRAAEPMHVAVDLASLRIERLPNRCFHWRSSEGTANKKLHYLLTVHKARELRERSLSTVFTACDVRNSCFTVHVNEAGALGRRLEVVFISDSPSEMFSVPEVVTVKMKLPYGSTVQSLLQETEDAQALASGGRRQVFYADVEDCWLDNVRDEDVRFEIEMRQ